MSYKPGDLKITETCTHDECEDSSQCIFDGSRPWVCDSREKLYRHDDPAKPPYQKHGAYLPHSCDEWYIGGHAQLIFLLKDVVAAIGKAPCTSRTFNPDGGDLCGGPVSGSVMWRLWKAFPELYQHPGLLSRISHEIAEATGSDVSMRRMTP